MHEKMFLDLYLSKELVSLDNLKKKNTYIHLACLSVCVHYAPKIKMTKLIGPNFFENATILTESYAKLFCFFLCKVR